MSLKNDQLKPFLTSEATLKQSKLNYLKGWNSKYNIMAWHSGNTLQIYKLSNDWHLLFQIDAELANSSQFVDCEWVNKDQDVYLHLYYNSTYMILNFDNNFSKLINKKIHILKEINIHSAHIYKEYLVIFDNLKQSIHILEYMTMKHLKVLETKGLIDFAWIESQHSLVCLFKREIRYYEWTSKDDIKSSQPRDRKYLSNESNLKKILSTTPQVCILGSTRDTPNSLLLDPMGISETLCIITIQVEELIKESFALMLNFNSDIDLFYSVDGYIFLSDNSQRHIHVVNMNSKQCLETIDTSDHIIKGILFDGDSKQIVYLKADMKPNEMNALFVSRETDYENLYLVYHPLPLSSENLTIQSNRTIPSNVENDGDRSDLSQSLLLKILDKLTLLENGQKDITERLNRFEDQLERFEDRL